MRGEAGRRRDFDALKAGRDYGGAACELMPAAAGCAFDDGRRNDARLSAVTASRRGVGVALRCFLARACFGRPPVQQFSGAARCRRL